jgi:hypothetical protein
VRLSDGASVTLLNVRQAPHRANSRAKGLPRVTAPQHHDSDKSSG